MTQECKHPDFWFSRQVCFCGAMHYYCVECGKQDDRCRDGGM